MSRVRHAYVTRMSQSLFLKIRAKRSAPISRGVEAFLLVGLLLHVLCISRVQLSRVHLPLTTASEASGNELPPYLPTYLPTSLPTDLPPSRKSFFDFYKNLQK